MGRSASLRRPTTQTFDAMTQNDTADLRWVKLRNFRNEPMASFECLKTSARDGDSNAYSHLAYAYEAGEGIEDVDYQEAYKWYEKAYKEAHDVWGAIGLGRLFYYGKGVEKNYALARKYFEEADNNQIDYVYLMLGRIFHLGRGAERDLSKAKAYYELAVASGNVWAIKNLGTVEQELGNYWRGLLLRCKALYIGSIIAYRDIDDRRLAN